MSEEERLPGAAADMRRQLAAAGEDLEMASVRKSLSWHKVLMDRLAQLIVAMGSPALRSELGEEFEGVHQRFMKVFLKVRGYYLQKPRAHHSLTSKEKREILEDLAQVFPKE